MAIFTAIATAIVGAVTGLGYAAVAAAGTFSAIGIATSVLAGTLAITASSLYAKRMAAKAGRGDGGGRVQLPPATSNKIPVIYGTAYVGGPVTDAKISTDLKTMWYVVALAEHTDTTAGSEYTYDESEIYYDNKKVQFGAAGVVTGLINNTPNQTEINNNVSGKIRIWLFKNGYNSCQNVPGANAQTILSDPRIPAYQRWTSTDTMTNCAFAIVRVDYDTKAGTTNLGGLMCKITNSLTAPGSVIKDYMINTRYGCAIPLSRIDTASLTALDTYSAVQIPYDYDGNSFTQDRYKINGPVVTQNNCLTNLQELVDSCDSWLQYSELVGKWKVVINKAYDQIPDPVTINDLYLVDSSNLVGGINIAPINLNETYNQLEISYPNNNIKDQTDYQLIELEDYAPEVMSPNEAINKLDVDLPLVNNAVQAKYLGIRRLLQSREDLTVTFQLDYSGIQVEAGDVIRIKHEEYGWDTLNSGAGKLFRVVTVNEEKYPDGSLGTSISAIEYNNTIYADFALEDFRPDPNTGLQDPNIVSAPGTPVVTNNPDSSGTISSFNVRTYVPDTGSVLYMDFNFGNTSNIQTHKLYRTISSAAGTKFENSNSNANTFTYLSVDINDLPADSYYFSTVARNEIQGANSAVSNIFVWPGAGINAANIIDANGVNSNGNVLTSNVAIPNLSVNANVYLTGGTGQLAGNTYVTSITSNATPTIFTVTPTPTIALVNANIQVITGGIDGNAIVPNTMPGNRVQPNTLPGNTLIGNTVNGNVIIGNTLNGNVLIIGTVNGNSIISGTVNGNSIISGTLNGNSIISGTLNGNSIISGTLNGNAIISGTVNGNVIISGTVSNIQIANDTIISNNIRANAITAGKIDANAVTANTIAANAITAGKIDANAVTANTIAANAITAGKIDANAVTAGTIAANAVTANTIAANAVTAGTIAANAVTANTIAANAVTAGTIAANAVTANTVAANAITAGKIAANAVIAGTIAANAVTVNTIDANAVTADTIAADAVTAGKIAANAVTANTIAANAVTAGRIAANAVTSNTIAANAIIAGKIAANAVTVNTIDANAVTADTIAADAVTAGKIAANAVTANTIAANAVTAGRIAANAVTSNTIAANAITAGKIAANAVTVNTIDANAVTADTIAADAVTAGKIAANAVTAGRIAANAVTAGTVAANAITSITIAANSITAGKIDANAVTAGSIAANAVTAGTIAANAVTAGTIAANAVTAGTLAANSVTAGKIDANAVTAGTIAANAVTANTIAANAVTAGSIAANAVTAGTIAANAVTAGSIAANAVTAGTIAANAVTANTVAANAIIAGTIAANAVDANALQAFSITGGKVALGTLEAQNIKANTITFENLAIGAVTQSKSTTSDPIVKPIPFTNISNVWPANTRCVVPAGGVTIVPSTDPGSSANTEYVEGSRILVSYSVKFYVDPGNVANASQNWDQYNLVEIWKSGASSVFDRGINTIRQLYDVSGNATSATYQQLHAYGYAPGGLDLYSSDGGNSWSTLNANGTSKTVTGAYTFSSTAVNSLPRTANVGTQLAGPYQTRDSNVDGGLTYTGIGYRPTSSTANSMRWTSKTVGFSANGVGYRSIANGTVTTEYQNDFRSLEFSPSTGGNGYPYRRIDQVGGNSNNCAGFLFTGTNGDIYYGVDIAAGVTGSGDSSIGYERRLYKENVPNLLQTINATYSNPNANNYTYTAVAVGDTGTILRSERQIGTSDYANSWTAKATYIQGDNTRPVLTDFYAVGGDDTINSPATSKWVAVGQYGMIQSSTDDGDTWTQVYLGNSVTCDFNGVRYGNGKWVAVGDGGNIYVSSNAANANSWTQISTSNLNYTNGTNYGSIYGNSNNSRQLNTVNYNGEHNTWSIGGEGIILYSNTNANTFTVAYEQTPSETYDLTRVTFNGSWPNVANVSRPPAEQRILNNQIFSGTIVDTSYVAGQETTYYLVIGNMNGNTVLAGQVFLQVQEIKR